MDEKIIKTTKPDDGQQPKSSAPMAGYMRIKCAAIRYNGKIYGGKSHFEIGQKMIRDGICEPPFPGGEDQGFVTDSGLYVMRTPALMIAIRAGQVQEGKTINSRELFSEDL